MNDTREGFFSIEQLDRMNLKTLANPLKEPWDGGHLMALLVSKTYKGRQQGLTPDEATQNTVDWYCSKTTEEVIKVLEDCQHDPEYMNCLLLMEYRNADPEGFERALQAIEDGWRPGDPVNL